MSEFEIRRYDPSMKRMWDIFADTSRNATFLFRRDYVEYHSDRFTDYSLIALKNGKIVSALPANIIIPDKDNRHAILQSHGGLTYGGWMLPPAHFDGNDMLRVFDSMIAFCCENGIGEIDYKPLPTIYAKMPSDEDIYALYRLGARLESVMLSSAIDMGANRGFNTLRRRGLRKARSSGATISETNDPCAVMELVRNCLDTRHNGACPVHSAAEMMLLTSRFPSNIRMFTATAPDSESPDACVVIYDTATTAHCQYIATSARGRTDDLLAFLFDHLINIEFADKKYFDFGTSNEQGGKILNSGLLRQKASLGGTGVAYMRFTLTL